LPVKKGRHRRFEEARALKRSSSSDLDAILGGGDNERCAECGGIYGLNQASWCPGPPECEAAVRALAAFPATDDDDDDDEDDDEDEDEACRCDDEDEDDDDDDEVAGAVVADSD
jgi:hypothetical protein